MAKKTIWLLASIMFVMMAICFVIFYFFFKKQTDKQSPITGNASMPSSNNSDGLISELKNSLLTKITEVSTQMTSLNENVTSITNEVSDITTEVSSIKTSVGSIQSQHGPPIHKRFDLEQGQTQLVLTGIDPSKILDIELNGLTLDSATEYTIEGNTLIMSIIADDGDFLEIEYTS
jgi:hypothetical protein